MYVVYVLAAILLSVAPMHATTVLAALPSSGSQRAASPRGARIERCGYRSAQFSSAQSTTAPYTTGSRSQGVSGNQLALLLVQLPVIQQEHRIFLSAKAGVSPDANLLAHSPNAP